MIRALSTAASGLGAQQLKIEGIASDLANINTDSYKQTQVEFQDNLYETLKEPDQAIGLNAQKPVGIQVGMGVRVGAAYKNFEIGPMRPTYQPYDLMIQGPGFFSVQTPQGEVAYTRNGAFHLDSQGMLKLSQGCELIPPIVIPNQARQVIISPAGEVRATLANGEETVIGQIPLVSFQNPQGLLALGQGLYQKTVSSGEPVLGVAGENGLGPLHQGGLEGSNVNVATSMVDMITAQRAYEMSTKLMGVVDQMTSALVNIK